MTDKITKVVVTLWTYLLMGILALSITALFLMVLVWSVKNLVGVL